MKHHPPSGAQPEAGVDMTRRAYRIRDFCNAFGVSRSTAYNLMGQGKLQSVRIAGRRLILADSAESLLVGGME